MENLLLIFIIIQSFLIAITFWSSSVSEYKSLIIYFSHIFLSTLLFGISENTFGLNIPPNDFVRILYELISLSKPIVIVYFLYFLLNKNIPKIYHFLWGLPILNFKFDYLLRTYNKDFYNAGFYENWYSNFPFYVKVLLVIILFNLLNVFKKEIKEKKALISHEELLKLYWGKIMILFLLILSASLVMYVSFTLMNGRLFDVNIDSFKYTAEYYNLIHHSFTALYLFIFSYLLFKSSIIFKTNFIDSSIEQKIIEIVLPSEEKSVNISLNFSKEQILEFSSILDKLMFENKVYLDSELSIDKLAEISGIKSRILSQFIQYNYQKKYKDYINSFRVIEAKKNLKDCDLSTTLFSIALDSGFNSESTFYKVFKEHTKITPKQFREKSI